jgi:hypothetical protein
VRRRVEPLYVQVVELGGGDSPRPDWTFAGFENIAGALSGLPKPDHRKALGEKCVMLAECQPGLDCPCGRCIQAEQRP